MGIVRLKEGAEIGRPAPAGFTILGAIYQLAADSDQDVVITSGQEARGRARTDTHMLGVAYDLRAAGLDPREIGVRIASLERQLGDQFLVLFEVPPGVGDDYPEPLKSKRYINPKATAVHLHVALRKGETYP